ncbi:MAG: mucin-associated surface protein [Micromonosporaceae bacterium]|nr:mucin-associated surface protein [Micromonosporaceae bacterium]
MIPRVARTGRGAVTAELAAAAPALVLMLMVGLTGIEGAVTRLRCFDVAREAALAEARGGSGEQLAERNAPEGATVTIQRDGETVQVRVRAPVRLLATSVPGLAVEGTAVAAMEPTG